MTEVDRRRESMEEARRAHDRLDEFARWIDDSTVKSADAALRNCLLINGGAAVAILAFMGAVVSKDAGRRPPPRSLRAEMSRKRRRRDRAQDN